MRSHLLTLALAAIAVSASSSADLAPETLPAASFLATVTPLEISAAQAITYVLREDRSYCEVALPSQVSRATWCGTFAYQRTGATTADLTLDADGATAAVTYRLTFAAPGIGTYTIEAEAPRAFSLLPLDAAWRVANVSNRGRSSPDSPCIAGFVVDGRHPRLVLIRVAGPALGDMGVAGAAENPAVRVYLGSTVIAENDDWGATGGRYGNVADAITATGAFPFLPGSQDAALVLSLPPGAYTIHGLVTEPGEILIEAYLVP